MAYPKAKKVAARLSVGLTEPQYDALQETAERYDATAAWVIRRAVAVFLERRRSIEGRAGQSRRLANK